MYCVGERINAIPSLATSAKARVSLIIERRAPLLFAVEFEAGFARSNSPHARSFEWMARGSMAFHGRQGATEADELAQPPKPVRSDHLFVIFDSSN